MKTEEIIAIIQKHSLVVRCLPNEIVNCYQYSESLMRMDLKIGIKREIVIKKLDLDYFKKNKPVYGSNDTPEQRLNRWNKRFPEGQKLIRETRTPEHGGWWCLEEVKNTGKTVNFSKKYLAPTLEEAINLYLKSIGEV